MPKLNPESHLQLALELDWLLEVIKTRIELHTNSRTEHRTFFDVVPANLIDPNSPYTQFVKENALSVPERIVFALASAPYLKPHLLDIFLSHSEGIGRAYSEFGGRRSQSHSGFLPTAETALFILAGDDMIDRIPFHHLFNPNSKLFSNNLLGLTHVGPGEPSFSRVLFPTIESFEKITTGEELKPRFSSEFPAKRMQTTLEWDDLVLGGDARKQVAEIKLWLQHKEAFLGEWEMSRKFKPGYSALFHGPPGTGKTMTASLLGKATGRDVYRIDLSSVISKYIGETEKNLARIFDLAENKEWILFFDEADSLFGKRGKVSDARDRYANQDISFLLQRLEDFNGLSILASNLKSNIDEAFMRRFQAIIYFPLPNPEMRYQLWKQAIPKRAKLERKVKILDIAHKYELTGAAIMNVVRHATLKTIDGGDEIMREEYLMEGIKREYFKVGKVV
jgi:AAA+ superfamily predicted ATPase